MGVADGAFGELPALHRRGQTLGRDFVGRVVGVEAQGHQQFAVGHHLGDGAGVGGELFAAAPQVGVQRIQKAPQRRGLFFKGGGCHRLAQRGAVGRVLDERLFDKGRAVEIGQAGVADATGL